MANDHMKENQTMQHERAKGTVSGNDRQKDGSAEQGRETGSHQGSQERSAIGGQNVGQQGSDNRSQTAGQQGGDKRSETGEPGRARNELDEKKNESTGR